MVKGAVRRPIHCEAMTRALHLPPLATTPPFSRQLLPPKPFTAFIFFSSISKPHSKKSPPSRFRRESAAPRSSINDEKHGDSAFFDEDGVIDDMECYLNNISLEYESVWDTKPSWCQPWTILLGGMIVIASSWIWLQSIVISTVVSCLISAWWCIFLYSYPKRYVTIQAVERLPAVSPALEAGYEILYDTYTRFVIKKLCFRI
ncbi:hypothetical protein KSP40_PGU009684 [Platanthera guangdongensis]|uniref:DUF6737 domain-containing protein n=1 Tax=Platanthera guangdongensis TaxID=2320717 RepID=A0ABR2LDF1_9ASPA